MEVFGEFTTEDPWVVKVPCQFDPFFQCFKTDVEIKIGQSFKFIVDDGKRYVISNRYQKIYDGFNNENNQYNPSKINRA